MDTESALNFLRSNQPLPPDNELTEELITQYDEVRKHFIQSPDSRSIPLFLNSFGLGSGFGIYQLVEDVITQFPDDEVVPHLVSALEQGSPSVRYWNAQIAANFPNDDLIDPLHNLLISGDEDTRSAAVTALERIPNDRVDEILLQALNREKSEEIRDLLSEAIEDRKNP
jgi:HEAT repeats